MAISADGVHVEFSYRQIAAGPNGSFPTFYAATCVLEAMPNI